MNLNNNINSLNKRDLRCHAENMLFTHVHWKAQRRRRKDEKTKAKRRKRKDESEKTLNSGLQGAIKRLHVFIISLFRLRYFLMSPPLFRLFAFVFSLWRLRYVAAK